MSDDFVCYLHYFHDRRFGNPIPDNIIEEMSAKNVCWEILPEYQVGSGYVSCLKVAEQRMRVVPHEVIEVDLEDASTVAVDSLVYSVEICM